MHGTSLRGLVGIEYDRVNPGWPVRRPIEILSHSPLTCRGVRSYADSAYYTHHGRAGVFSTGTMRWVRSFNGDARAMHEWPGTRSQRHNLCVDGARRARGRKPRNARRVSPCRAACTVLEAAKFRSLNAAWPFSG